MIIELAMAGMLSCQIVYKEIVKEDLMCFYTCKDSSREFASTLKQYQCPKVLYVERPALPFKERDFKGNKWTREAIDKITGE
jgi:hypothetical protein|tara:strand:+ start:707 stop:952 length:246 start_codon:yes stop_codon:yes gene_type:complete